MRYSLFLLIVLAAGCARETAVVEGGSGTASGTAAPVAADPAETSVDSTIPVGGPSFLESVTVASRLPRGDAAAEEASHISRGDQLHVVTALRQAPAGSVLSAVAKRDGEIVAEARKELAVGARREVLSFEGTSEWKPGSYTIEISMGGKLEASKPIRVD
ncbi:MAG TPA: hypothetical protein VM557_08600 [Thermoanaerobaculia bacterium]|nr:hypothetical protein [Thermoanaerobaculia bacterium]